MNLKQFSAAEAAAHLVERMTASGYMSGFLGDDGEEFKRQQAQGILDMRVPAFIYWLEQQGGNLNAARVNHLATIALFADKQEKL